MPPEDDSLLQGDFLNSVGVPVMPPDQEDIPLPEERPVDAEVTYRNVVVLSPSCDLFHGKLEYVLVAPHQPLTQAKEKHPILLKTQNRDALRQGNQVGLHPLNQCDIPGFETEVLVVDFRSAFTIPLSYAIDRAARPGVRLRLMPPYREHLAQAYARFIMRIGLPVDIPKLQ